jgi:hypothetical protein
MRLAVWGHLFSRSATPTAFLGHLAGSSPGCARSVVASEISAAASALLPLAKAIARPANGVGCNYLISLRKSGAAERN